MYQSNFTFSVNQEYSRTVTKFKERACHSLSHQSLNSLTFVKPLCQHPNFRKAPVSKIVLLGEKIEQIFLKHKPYFKQ